MATSEAGDSLSPLFDDVELCPAVGTGHELPPGQSLGPQSTTELLLGIISLEARLIFSAIAIIYVGAHASLRRPPSAAPSTKTKRGKPKKRDEGEPQTHGLLPSDAILFPLFAGVVLIGLYYLIQWLQDPAILSKFLRAYMCVVGLASLTSFNAHSLQLVLDFLFPNYYRAEGVLYEVDGSRDRLVPVKVPVADDADNNHANGHDSPEWAPLSPVPWLIARPRESVTAYLWNLRHFLTEEWTLRLRLPLVGSEKFTLFASHVASSAAALIMVTVYLQTNSPMLANYLGYAFCYSSFLFISPTTFVTGSLVLVGLFFYDIIMVFYTPFMIAVATQVDAPLKLTFESAARSSMLGLGDIALPGMIMCLALRFDLWRHYQSQIRYEPTELASDSKDESSGQVTQTKQTHHIAKKVPYIEAASTWSDRFWSASGLNKLLLRVPDDCPAAVRAGVFPKTYFYASIIGYFVGMITTLAMLVIFKHGQPALLYLVPGVLGSLWLTGLVRGEIKDMWAYTEDGSLDTKDVVVELDADGNVMKEIKQDDDKAIKEKAEAEEKKQAAEREAKAKELAAKRAKDGYDIVHFSIRVPRRHANKAD